jgi:hypothetical protein
MSNDDEDAPVVSKTEARQGVQVRPQVWVLVIGLILGAVALVALLTLGPGSDVEVPPGGDYPSIEQPPQPQQPQPQPQQ